MFNFEKLAVYQEGIKFTKIIYTASKSWPRDEIFGLISQIRRAAVSIVLNIAEGSSRTKKGFRHFLDLSNGSCFEVVAVLTIAKKLGYLSEEEFSRFYGEVGRISHSIHSLKKSLL